MTQNSDEPLFNKEKHVRYWLMNFKTYLPTGYQSMDSNRMFLAFLTICALDILDILHVPDGKVTATERAGAVEWIYNCQHPDGGFRAFLGTDFGSGRRNEENGCWDPANVAGTFFALASLIVLRDDMKKVERQKCLTWLCKLQASDGSFAEVLGPDGRPEGRTDVRYSYLAAAIRYILALPEGQAGKDDIDKNALAKFVLETQAHDGGLGEGRGAEPQGGFAYCGTVALILLGVVSPDSHDMMSPREKPNFLEDLTGWLLSRQVYYRDPEESDEDGDENDNEDDDHKDQGDTVTKNGAQSLAEAQKLPADDQTGSKWIGFDGRCNKPADTCYTFWVGATLCILGYDRFLDQAEHRRFLLQRTQHKFGGFGKCPGDLPDMMHSCLGLVALKMMGYDDLEAVDPIFCMTARARSYLEQWRQGQLSDTAH